MLNKKAFTLVELIVVITILAILGTIAFISLQGYNKDARDSTRISDLGSIKKVLELYSLENGKYPEPTLETYPITYSGSELWTQGNYGENTLKETQRISNIPLDPLTKTPYTYSLLNTKKEYEIGAAFEGELSKLNTKQTNANGTKILTSYVSGNYNGKVAKVETGTTTYVLAVPTIINSRLDLEDYQDIANNQALAIKGSNTIAGSYTGTEVKLNGTNQKVINENNIVIFEGDLENIDSQTFVENMQGAYSGTQVTTNELENLLSIDTNDSDEVNNYANNVISNNLESVAVKTEKNVNLVPDIDNPLVLDGSLFTGGIYSISQDIDQSIWKKYQVKTTNLKEGGNISVNGKNLELQEEIYNGYTVPDSITNEIYVVNNFTEHNNLVLEFDMISDTDELDPIFGTDIDDTGRFWFQPGFGTNDSFIGLGGTYKQISRQFDKNITYRIKIIFDGTTMNVYSNDSLVASISGGNINANYLWIGGGHQPDRIFQGTISNISLNNKPIYIYKEELINTNQLNIDISGEIDSLELNTWIEE